MLKNPYADLSWEAKELVDNLASMGFPRDRTARAVQKLGQDDKQVYRIYYAIIIMKKEVSNQSLKVKYL